MTEENKALREANKALNPDTHRDIGWVLVITVILLCLALGALLGWVTR